MILKKKWIIERKVYYRTKISLDKAKDFHGMCYYCNIPIRLCRKDKLECLKTNYILSSLKITTYRYFPYAPEEKVYLTEVDI